MSRAAAWRSWGGRGILPQQEFGIGKFFVAAVVCRAAIPEHGLAAVLRSALSVFVADGEQVVAVGFTCGCAALQQGEGLRPVFGLRKSYQPVFRLP